MFLVDWFYGVLESLAWLWQKEAKILFLGLDNAGKTTLLHMLKDEVRSSVPPARLAHAHHQYCHPRNASCLSQRVCNRLVQHAPTQHPTSSELRIGRIRFKAFDLGGHRIARRVWKDYYAKVDAVVYMVDAADGARRSWTRYVLSDDALAGVPFLVLGNKIDVPHAAPERDLRGYLGLAGCTTGKGDVELAGTSVRPLEVFMCSVVRKMGYGEGFRWMAQYII
ncbi:hypothetical protein EJB05_12991, partial [Eragrostis curvula]